MKKKLIGIICCIVVLVLLVGIGLFASARGKENNLQEHLDLGAQYLDKLDYEKAIAEYMMVLDIEPKCVEAYLSMTDAYIGLEDYQNALSIAQEGYEITHDERLSKKVQEVQEIYDSTTINTTPLPVATVVPAVQEVATPEPVIRLIEGTEELVVTFPTSYELVTGTDKVFITKNRNNTFYYEPGYDQPFISSPYYYGIIDYNGNEIVPSIYNTWYKGPNEKGYFSLGNKESTNTFERFTRTQEETALIFDNNGRIKLKIEHLGDFIIEGNKVLYSRYYVDTENQIYHVDLSLYDLSKEVVLYHIENSFPQELLSNYIDGVWPNRYTPIVLDDNHFYYVDESMGALYEIIVEDGSSRAEIVESMNEKVVSALIDEGYAMYCSDTYMSLYNSYEQMLTSLDGIECYSFYIEKVLKDWYETDIYNTDAGLKCLSNIEELSRISMTNKGKIVVLSHFDWTNEEPCTHLLDMSYAEYDENGSMKNPEDVIRATYRYIALSDAAIYLAQNWGEGETYYIDGTGKVIQGGYLGGTDFKNGYAMIIETNGHAYIVDENFHKVAGGYEAYHVYRCGELFVIENWDEKIYLKSPAQ